MSEVEAAVRALGKAMQADPRYTAYYEAKAANDADGDLQEEIHAFYMKRMSWQMQKERDAGQDAEKLEQIEAELQAAYDKILANPLMQQFQKAKEGMEVMLHQINSLIHLCANGVNPDTCQPDLSGCTGNCTSCGGCH